MEAMDEPLSCLVRDLAVDTVVEKISSLIGSSDGSSQIKLNSSSESQRCF